MEYEEFKAKLKEEFENINISIKDEQSRMFYTYMEMLLDWNTKINLTSITIPSEIITKHFLDSVSVLEYIKEGDKVIDIGSGAGFPGVPIRIMKDCNMILMDSLNKRINFLKLLIEELKLETVHAIHSRAEDMANDSLYREKCDVAISRAVAPLNVLLEYALPFVKVGGKFICMKGPNVKEELECSKKALHILGGRIEEIKTITLSKEMERNIVIIKKDKLTPKQFPRKAGKPGKEPIGAKR